MRKDVTLKPGKTLRAYGDVHFGAVTLSRVYQIRIYKSLFDSKKVNCIAYDDMGEVLAQTSAFTKVCYYSDGFLKGLLFFE